MSNSCSCSCSIESRPGQEMRLTPIKVRGKRGQPRPFKKRRMQGKHDADDDPSVRRRRTLRLYQLPQEILERIFITSQNLSLPLVNRELYHMLSSDSIKYRLVGAAFGPTWDAFYGCDNFEVASYDGWQLDAPRIEGDPTFQSAVLACPWAKLPMLLSSFDVWIRQQSNGRVYFTVPELKRHRLSMAPQPGSPYDRAHNDETDDATSTHAIMTMREKLAFDLANFEAIVSPSTWVPYARRGTIPRQTSAYHLGALLGMHLEVHPHTRIPDDLLSGPFESDDGAIDTGTEKMQRLFWLVRGGACLQEDQTWEVTREGFQQILRLVRADDDDDDDDDKKQQLPDTPMSAEGCGRLDLAGRLLALFELLGVFDTRLHWPRYVAHTSLAQVSALDPRGDPSTTALLSDLATLLHCVLVQPDVSAEYRRQRGRHGLYGMRGMRHDWVIADFFLRAPRKA